MNKNKSNNEKETKNNEGNKGSKDMSIDNNLLMSILPKDERIVKLDKKTPKIPKVTKTKIPKKTKHTPTPEAETSKFEGPEPFKNCNKFVQFYMSITNVFCPGAKFYDGFIERTYATEVLDLLILNGRGGDIKFLKSWIQYYAFTNLRGNNATNKEKTSIKSFKNSFETFKGKYVD